MKENWSQNQVEENRFGERPQIFLVPTRKMRERRVSCSNAEGGSHAGPVTTSARLHGKLSESTVPFVTFPTPLV